MVHGEKRISIVLVLIILLPLLVFVVYQFSSINESEKNLEVLYTNRLDAILFSVNQYSDDVVNSWAYEINSVTYGKNVIDDNFGKEIQNIFKSAPSVRKVLFARSSDNQFNLLDVNQTKPIVTDSISRLLATKHDKITKLKKYFSEGYRKIEPISIDSKTLLLLFVLKNRVSDYDLCGIIISPEDMLKEVLIPKITATSKNELDIMVLEDGTDKRLFSTSNTDVKEFTQRKNIWLLPNYSLGIALGGKSIQAISKERVLVNMGMITILFFSIVTGVYFFLYNFRKEIELARLKADFVSNVSHELRTPLTMISMYAETLELGRVKSEEKKMEYYSIINMEANRLGKMVNKILNFSQMEAGKRRFNMARLDINPLVTEIYEAYQKHLELNGFSFELISSLELPEIYGDFEAITEAVTNLLDNAIKYSTERKHIRLRTGVRQGFVYVEVWDEGMGIKEEEQKRIFDKFFRASHSIDSGTKGAGLGLSLVKQIMDLHKGKITLLSSFGKGSSFRLNFPAIKA